ncbi:hypothetical protein L1887_36407 [Cichorium endivia]|nr:hypothetical protein L1887_36407 [Cichorium endivia]
MVVGVSRLIEEDEGVGSRLNQTRQWRREDDCCAMIQKAEVVVGNIRTAIRLLPRGCGAGIEGSSVARRGAYGLNGDGGAADLCIGEEEECDGMHTSSRRRLCSPVSRGFGTEADGIEGKENRLLVS